MSEQDHSEILSSVQGLLNTTFGKGDSTLKDLDIFQSKKEAKPNNKLTT